MLVFSSIGFTQANIKFEYIGIKPGLSSINVSSVIQDSRGFMWFGTPDGLNKYDGYEFTVYKNNPLIESSLNNNSIKSIIEDKKDVIWVGTWGGGLNKFDREKNKFVHFKHNPTDRNTISSDFITCLLEDKAGHLWIGTGDGNLDMLDAKNNRFIHYSNPKNNDKGLKDAYVTCIIEDSQFNLWIGTVSNGLHLLDKSSGSFKDFLHSEKDSNSLFENSVNTIFEDTKKNIWVGTNNGGLDLMDKKNEAFSHFKKNILKGNSFTDYSILSMMEDNVGNIWIGTRDGGLNIFNPSAGTSRNYHHDELDVTSLSQNTVNSIYSDPKGDIWITTVGGINLVNTAGKEFVHYKHDVLKNSLSNNNVASIYEDTRKNLWIGTDGGGLNLFESSHNNFIHYKHRANDNNSICGDKVLSICEDGKGNLWIGTWATGITVFNKETNTFKHFKNDPLRAASLGSNNVWAIRKDRENNMWIGTYGEGLDMYNPADNSFAHYKHDENDTSSINNNQVITIFEDSKGFIWTGTDGGGLNRFDKNTKKFTHFIHDNARNSLSYDYVSDIFEDNAQNLYIATGTGLNYFNTQTGHFSLYPSIDGTTGDAVYGMMPDGKGNLWISTGKGISSFNTTTKKFTNFNVEDGLHANMYNSRGYCKTESGMMYFGGIYGFDGFFPDSIKKVPFDPKLVITDFQVFNKKVPVAIDEKDPSPLKKDITETNEITIPYSSSVISFEFALLHYGVQEKKQYAYMLEGFDKTWNEVGAKRMATYTNLDPGNYVFKVKGLNNEGQWSSRIVSIRLTITPPFWLTWWFRSGVLILIIGGGIAFYKFRINSIKAQKVTLERRVHEQTQQLILSAREEQRARKQVEYANEDLERKNKEIEQFAYIASHDLQEPLRTTSSFIALLQKQYNGKFDEKADKYFAFISDASDRMKVLIKNLLDYSRIGNKKELEQVDCNNILHDVIADLGTAISETDASIKYDLLPVINGYGTELKQLFQNLVANAIKFRKAEISPVVNISAQEKDGCWQFAFKDNGIGIDEKHNEKIFVIFQRLHARTEYEGSGIGLAHCKKIVELHKGKIWVESRPAEGSIFYFTIPNTNNHEER